ncbi:hypothetical protein DERP_009095 [Dermatophagoides pteronyssinus]|uniref:Uncharacterized protein n=1 Tax=Dermatophagoides pteronyssinus TaxID=6956 RepID=A0ABQ8JQI3_DERPT|nr:hypothetical protein DERP_009095 [Dermatophagoides pteronyssinus]
MMAKKTRRYRSCQVDRSHYKMVKSLIECMPTMFFEEDCQCFILLTARNDNDDHQWPNDQSIHRSLNDRQSYIVFYCLLLNN